MLTTNEILANAVVSVLERGAFLCVTGVRPDDAVVDPANSPWKASEEVLTATLQCPAGMVAIWVPASLAAIAAANMLGREPHDPDVASKAHDAVAEITNMVGGLIFDETTGGGKTEMALPVFQDPDSLRRTIAERGLRLSASVTLSVEDHHVVAALFQKEASSLKPK